MNFYTRFKNIQERVKDSLEIGNYTPYNLRHTFINNVYREGTKNDLSLLEISAITGNSYKTARKHYMDYSDNIITYVEALAKVTFSDVNVNGEISVSSKEYLSNRKVRNNLGNCKTVTCTFEIAECLVCKQFVTFIDRIPVFELMIEKLNNNIKDSTNPEEIKELVLTKKLVAKYLSELYKVKQSEE